MARKIELIFFFLKKLNNFDLLYALYFISFLDSYILFFVLLSSVCILLFSTTNWFHLLICKSNFDEAKDLTRQSYHTRQLKQVITVKTTSMNIWNVNE